MSYLELRSHLRDAAEINSSVMYAEHFMYHSLVCPLCKQWRDRVVSAIHNKQYRWRIWLPEIKQLIFLCYLISDFCRKLLRQQAGLFVSY